MKFRIFNKNVKHHKYPNQTPMNTNRKTYSSCLYFLSFDFRSANSTAKWF